MKTYKAICIEDTTIVDGDKKLELKRGKEYDIYLSEKYPDEAHVFSSYWGWVPKHLFAGIVP